MKQIQGRLWPAFFVHIHPDNPIKRENYQLGVVVGDGVG